MMKPTRDVALYIDPPSPRFLDDQLFNINNVNLIGDQLLAPYVHLRNFFTSKGVAVHTADHLPEKVSSTQNVYVAIGNTKNYRKIAQRKDTRLSAFFAMECPVVDPHLYRELNKVQKYFKRIFSWSDSPSLERFVGGPLRCESFCWPQSFEDVHEAIWQQNNRKFLVMINANKLPCVYWQELYTERMRAVEFFSRTGEIDLYGVGWDGPSHRLGKSIVPWSIRRFQKYLTLQWHRIHPDPLLAAAHSVYKGPAKSKAETLGNYTFALCFENSVLKGWITEKIFDCFFAGTVPIYWGAPDIESYVNPECFIDMRRFANYEELRSYLKSLNEKDIWEYKRAARAYLKSQRFRPFTKDAFLELFSRIVEEDTGLKL